MADQFETLAPGLEAPAGEFVEVVPNDVTNLANPSRYLYVGGTGDIVAVDLLGNTVTFKNVVAGTVLPIRAVRVDATGTTATSIIALR